MAIHSLDLLGQESEIIPGVVITSSREHISSLVDNDEAAAAAVCRL